MYLFNLPNYINEYLGLIGGKLIFGVGERRGRDPVCAFAQADRCRCLSLFMGGSREGDETGGPGPPGGHKNIGVLSRTEQNRTKLLFAIKLRPHAGGI